MCVRLVIGTTPTIPNEMPLIKLQHTQLKGHPTGLCNWLAGALPRVISKSQMSAKASKVHPRGVGALYVHRQSQKYYEDGP